MTCFRQRAKYDPLFLVVAHTYVKPFFAQVAHECDIWCRAMTDTQSYVSVAKIFEVMTTPITETDHQYFTERERGSHETCRVLDSGASSI